MKVTLEIPDSAICLTYQFVYADNTTWGMSIKQAALGSDDLDKFRREGNEDEKPQ